MPLGFELTNPQTQDLPLYRFPCLLLLLPIHARRRTPLDCSPGKCWWDQRHLVHWQRRWDLKKLDGGKIWRSLNNSLAITQFYGIGSMEANADLLVGGTQDLSSHIYNGGQWTTRAVYTVTGLMRLWIMPIRSRCTCQQTAAFIDQTTEDCPGSRNANLKTYGFWICLSFS